MIVWIEIISTLATVIAIAGVILNNHRRRSCFILWLGSNSLTLAVHLYVGLWSMSARDVIFIGLAIDGWYRWKEKATPEPVECEEGPMADRINVRGLGWYGKPTEFVTKGEGAK